MMGWLRRWLGESSTLAALREENARLLNDNATLRASANQKAERILVLLAEKNTLNREKTDVLERLAEVRATVHILVEPAQGDCDKVRVRSRAEGDRLARRVEEAVGAEMFAMEPYRCPSCPRQPLTNERFWHVRHVDPNQRGLHGAQYRGRRKEGPLLASRLPTGVPNQIRKDVAGGAA